jgi:hypothetical protein
MTTGSGFDVRRLRELLPVDHERLALARRRQAAVWRGEKPDAWPILFGAPLTEAQQAIPSPNLLEAFHDPDLMLCGQVRGACSVANAGSDAVPSARGNYGVGTVLSCLGLEQVVFPDKMPWPREHLSRQRIATLEPDDIRIQGTFARGLEFMHRAREVMGEALPLYCMDTQGPLDLAHLIMGDDFFYALHDDPPFVHHLLELARELGVRTHVWMKEIACEPLGRMHHSNGLYAENIGVRVCEDTTAIIAPAAIAEYAMPYTRELARRFGGAWMHYCGRNDHLTVAACALPEIRGINFGHIPGHEEDHPFEEDMARCRAAGKVYYGSWPRRVGESGRAYLERLQRWASQGCLIPSGDAAVGGPDGFPGVAAALDYWYSLN